jgi:hypothetical protein
MSPLATRAIAAIGMMLLMALGGFLITRNRLEAELNSVSMPRIHELAVLRAENRRLKERLEEIPTAPTPRLATPPVKQPTEPLVLTREAPSYRDQFIATFQAAAGAERYRAFALLNGERDHDGVRHGGPAEFFNTFGGEAARTVSISRDERGYRFEVRRVDGRGRQSGTAPDLTVLRERLGPLVQLLPPGF